MAGGVITTTIRGADDIESYIGGWTTEHQTDSDFVVNGAYNAVTNGFDFKLKAYRKTYLFFFCSLGFDLAPATAAAILA